MKTAASFTKILFGTMLGVLTVTSIPHASAHGPGDPWTAHYMWRRYHNTTVNCPNDKDKPEYECTGIILRATNPQRETTGAWVPEAKSFPGNRNSSGGVSFSYIRKDAKFGRLAFEYTNGFTVFPEHGKYKDPNPKGKKFHYLCAFPLDAATDNRVDNGCGARESSLQYGTPCKGETATEDGWMKVFDTYKDLPDHGFAYHRQCGFDTRYDHRSRTTFTTFLKITDRLTRHHPSTFSRVDELRAAVWAPNVAEATNPAFVATLPLESFFYITGTPQEKQGLANAQWDQALYYSQTKKFVPIVRIKMPKDVDDDFDFHYERSDQSPKVVVPQFPSKDPKPCKEGDFDKKC